MPISASAKKSLRQSLAKRRQNNKLKKKIREATSKFTKKLDQKSLSELFSMLDKAWKKNLYHKNKVARLKSKYHKMAKIVKKKAKSKKISK